MLSRVFRTTVVLIPVLGVTTSCEEPTQPTQPPDDRPSPTQIESLTQVRTSERESLELWRNVPAFGGAFFDEQGNIPVYLTDTTLIARVTPAINAMTHGRLDGVRGVMAQKNIYVLHAQYGFGELAAWRDVLSQAPWPAGLHTIDLDESLNRVRLETETQLSAGATLDWAVKLGVPREALVMDVSPIAVAAKWLTSQFRPIPGGVQAWTTRNDQLGACTLGFVAESDGVRVLVTNSHCTDHVFGLDNPSYPWHQPHPQANPDTIAWEWIDPPSFDCRDDLLRLRRCRNADAAALRLTDFGQLGYIARTRYARWHEPGSTEINDQDPWFQLVRRKDNNMEGETLDKIGVATGWTFGDVTNTCEDKTFSSNATGTYRVLCTDEVDAYIDFGDSGSPLFEWRDSLTAELRGIVIGKESDANWPMYISDLRQIEIDLGPLVVTSPGEPES